MENHQNSPFDRSSQVFRGIRFVLIGFDPINKAQVSRKLVNGGGVDAGQYGPNCTHVIVNKLVYDDPICVAARRDGKILVSGVWADHSFDVGVPVDPTSVMYRPVRDLNGIPGAKSLVMCLTGYQREDREDIMTMVDLMGARFSKPLIANKVTHLICYKFEGEKYVLAKRMKKIKLINHRWLEECLKAWEIVAEAEYCKSGYELEMEGEAKDSEDEAGVNEVKEESRHDSVRLKQDVSNTSGDEMASVRMKRRIDEILNPQKNAFEGRSSESRKVLISSRKVVVMESTSPPPTIERASNALKLGEKEEEKGSSFVKRKMEIRVPKLGKRSEETLNRESVHEIPCSSNDNDRENEKKLVSCKGKRDEPPISKMSTTSQDKDIIGLKETKPDSSRDAAAECEIEIRGGAQKVEEHVKASTPNEGSGGSRKSIGKQNVGKKKTSVSGNLFFSIDQEQISSSVAKSGAEVDKGGLQFDNMSGNKSLMDDETEPPEDEEAGKEKHGPHTTSVVDDDDVVVMEENAHQNIEKYEEMCVNVGKSDKQASREKTTKIKHVRGDDINKKPATPPVAVAVRARASKKNANGLDETAAETENDDTTQHVSEKDDGGVVGGKKKPKPKKAAAALSVKHPKLKGKKATSSRGVKKVCDFQTPPPPPLVDDPSHKQQQTFESKNKGNSSDCNTKEAQPMWFILSGHKLQKSEFQQILRRLKGKICRVSHQWSYQATHFIVPAPIKRTEKFFAAAASGSWILKTDFLSACNEAGRFLSEEPYEWHKIGLSEDGQINLEAPRKWRLFKDKTGHGAFFGMRLVIYGECIAPTLDTLKRAVKAGDGTIVATAPPYTRFLNTGIDYAIVSPGMPHVDIWVQEFIKHEIPCVSADYLVEYVCKPGYPLDTHVLFDTNVWAQRSCNKNRLLDEQQGPTTPHTNNDVACEVCRSRDRGEDMLVCGSSTGCGLGMHIDCCDPPFEHVPEDDWFCPTCTQNPNITLANPKRKAN